MGFAVSSYDSQNHRNLLLFRNQWQQYFHGISLETHTHPPQYIVNVSTDHYPPASCYRINSCGQNLLPCVAVITAPLLLPSHPVDSPDLEYDERLDSTETPTPTIHQQPIHQLFCAGIVLPDHLPSSDSGAVRSILSATLFWLSPTSVSGNWLYEMYGTAIVQKPVVVEWGAACFAMRREQQPPHTKRWYLSCHRNGKALVPIAAFCVLSLSVREWWLFVLFG